MEKDILYFGDCLDLLPWIPSKSIDMILADLPFGTTRNKWDSLIPLDLLWNQYERVIKDRGAIILTAQTPFDKVLGASNLKLLKYEWIWEKDRATGHLNAKKMPMKAHENVLVFYKKLPVYNPQKTHNHKPMNISYGGKRDNNNYGEYTNIDCGGATDRYPRSCLKFNTVKANSSKYLGNGTQKPVEMFEYFIKTYTYEGHTVLDNTAGTGTTGEACFNTNRHFILMEKDPEQHTKIVKRLKNLGLKDFESFM